MNRSRTLAAAALVSTAALALTGCATDADRASRNLSQAADQFEIERRVIFFNGITDEYLLTIEGLCSIEDQSAEGNPQLEVTCKTGPESYKKHFLGLSDNVSYFVEQGEPAEVDVYRYRVIIKPETVAPDFDVETSVDLEGDG